MNSDIPKQIYGISIFPKGFQRFFSLFQKGKPFANPFNIPTLLFYQNSVEIYSRFDDWKDIDKFYFTLLFLEHPDLFQYKCPMCGRTVYPHRYVGSPLSGTVALEGHCECGWKGHESVSGWQVRAVALRDCLKEDKRRWKRFRWFRGTKIAIVPGTTSKLERCE